MAASLEAPHSTEVDLALTDLGPLAWVLEELRKAVGSATRALRRFIQDGEGQTVSERGSADVGQLRVARQQLHQAAGALDMVGQTAPAIILRAMESAVQQCIQRPETCDEDAVGRMERAGFGLLQYLEAVLQGKPASPVALFPQYRDVQALAKQERAHPADLWPMPWRWINPAMPVTVKPLAYDSAVRARFEQAVLKVIKSRDPAAARLLRDISMGFSAAQSARQPSVFWKIAAGFFDALSLGLCPNDVHVKRAVSRILQQYTALVRGELGVSDRLAQDLVFFCAQARPEPESIAPTLMALRQGFGLVGWQSVDYEASPFGRFDPALLTQARKRIGAAKEAWSAVAGGDLARMRGLTDQFSLVADSLVKLHPPSTALASGLTQAADATARSGMSPSTALAMEVATSVMFLEAAFEELDPSDAELAGRTARLAERLARVQSGGRPEPLEVWIEELYRRVSDRQTMGSVVGELRTALGDLERSLDLYFRSPKDIGLLDKVPGELSQMRGVLSVLGLDQAVRTVLHMRDVVGQLMGMELNSKQVVASGIFEKLGNNLGALGLLFDMLSYQPALAKKLFIYDEAEHELKPLMGRLRVAALPMTDASEVDSDETVDVLLSSASAVEASDSAPFLPTNFGESEDALADALSGFAATNFAPSERQTFAATEIAGLPALAPGDQAENLLDLPLFLEPDTPAVPMPQQMDAVESDSADLDEDDLLGIFLDEAREVVQGGCEAVAALADTPADLDQQTILRRAFHTLKGSSRMVGLAEFGEAAWSMEQLLNTWLADRRPASNELRLLSQEALQCFGQWAQDIADGYEDVKWNAAMFQKASDALRLEDRLESIQSAQTAADVHLPLDFAAALQGLPSLDLPAVVADAVEPEEAVSLDIGEPPGAEAPVASVPVPTVANEPLLPAELVIDPADHPMDELSMDAISLDFPEAVEDIHVDAAAFEIEEIDLGSLSELAAGVQHLETDRTPSVESDVLPETAAWTSELELSAVQALGEKPAQEPSADQVDAEILAAFEAEVAQSAEPGYGHGPGTEAVDPVPEVDLGVPVSATEEDDGADFLGDVHKEHTRAIGSLRISIPLYNVYLNEADEWSRRLLTELSEWELELHHRPVSDLTVSLAHSLAGSSATVGFTALSSLARELEHALQCTQLQSTGTPEEGQAYTAVAEDIRRLLHQFAAGFLKEPDPEVLAILRRLHADKEPAGASPLGDDVVQVVAPTSHLPTSRELPHASLPDDLSDEDDIESTDALDPDLFQIFEEEAQDLMPMLGGALRQWVLRPDNGSARAEVLRVLHTLKGSARLAGAMRLGERAHRMETAIERLDPTGNTPDVSALELLLTRFDTLQTSFENLRLPEEHTEGALTSVSAEVQPLSDVASSPATPDDAMREAENTLGIDALPTDGKAGLTALHPVTGSQDTPVPPSVLARTAVAAPSRGTASGQVVRIRSQLLDSLVNQTGEVMMTRSRLEAGVGQLRSSMVDLNGNLERLRQQLRDIELQAELQMQSRLAHTKDADRSFDPLEFDRFTRVQELTRMMAESVNDVATVQRNLERTLDSADADLVAQTRQTRDLQRDLLRTRMQEFETIAERLYRVVRQASKDSGKQVKLDITGGSIEMDRGVLDRMTPAFEHLLRNAVGHGIESSEAREAAGKPVAGAILIELRHDGNDVSMAFSDDGVGLDSARIRDKALALGLITADQELAPDVLHDLIFMPGFSTASQITELSGRGIGMDVVRSEVQALGGRIELTSEPGKGTRFNLILPLTTAVTQVVMVRIGRLSFGIPSNVVEQVRRTPADELRQTYTRDNFEIGGEAIPFYWAGALLQSSARSDEPIVKTASVVVLRSAQQRVAVHVDEVLGNQEVVVKNLGPQLSRLPGLSGMTVLPSGAVVLIYNPVALASVYGPQARRLQKSAPQASGSDGVPSNEGVFQGRGTAASQVPLVLVVDDSITVRRVTQRLLQREGYRVVLAVDGVQAVERLRAEMPAVMLSDIEMPRMDGFELARSVRSHPAWKALPIITISSRTAEKHRQMASEIGINHYLGKPYGEEELLSLIRRYARPLVPV